VAGYFRNHWPDHPGIRSRGLAGAVLRNYLYDLEATSKQNKEQLKINKGVAKLGGSALKRFRETDPWERLNTLSRETFGFEIKVDPFDPDFHTVLRVLVQPKELLENGRWKNAGVARDIMVEGAGAQQWLTVLTFALAPETSVLLLDEPDAHLFTGLKLELIRTLDDISSVESQPQILLATHATEILKRYPCDRILNFGNNGPKFLTDDIERAKLISGLGDDYAPLIEKARASKKLLFVENQSDLRIFKRLSESLGLNWPAELAFLSNTDKHSDRLKLYRSLLEAIDGLVAISVRDKDNLNLGEVDEATLQQKGIKAEGFPAFFPLTLRRREIENYALVSTALVASCGEEVVKNWWQQRGWAWPQTDDIFEHRIRPAVPL